MSATDQNTERQLDGIPVDRTFTDKASGKSTDRPTLTEALRYLRDGGAFVIHSMVRLARNLEDLRRTVRELNARGARRVHEGGLTFTEDSPMSTLLLSMLGAVAEFERSLILERQRKGIALATVRGVYKGRKAKLSRSQAAELCGRLAAGESATNLATEYRISRQSVYNYRSGSAACVGQHLGGRVACEFNVVWIPTYSS